MRSHKPISKLISVNLKTVPFTNTNAWIMETNRRKFIGDSLKLATIGSITGAGLLISCNNNKHGEDEKEVSPPEDLMQEHGLLNRILLIYEHCKYQFLYKQPFPVETLANAAGIIRTFVEDYHEKQEEQYLFPRFQKANQLTVLVNILLQQHQAGRRITDRIIQLTKSQHPNETETQQLIKLMTEFDIMYRPHEAREDTVLFPAFRKLVSKNEYDSLGEEFENNEHKLFGKDGFESMVDNVEEIEKALGLFDLAQYTPKA